MDISISPQRDCVLENPELLELVLLQCDLRTLICAQRVCRRWHNATKSPALQEALFLRPRRAREGEKPTMNPLLTQYFPAWFAPSYSWKERYELETTSWTRDPMARDKFLRPESSWKCMLPVQPPLTELRLITRTHFGELQERKGKLILGVNDKSEQPSDDARSTASKKRKKKTAEAAQWNGRDINMGLIYHLAQTYLRERVVSYFCMLYPSQVQQVLDRQISGTLPSSSALHSTAGELGLLGKEALDAIREEQGGDNKLIIVFEQLRNWFEPSDTTGNWLEEQNAIFARLNLRGWNGPVIWDQDAIEWQIEDDSD